MPNQGKVLRSINQLIRAQIDSLLSSSEHLTSRQAQRLTTRARQRTQQEDHVGAEKLYRLLIAKEAADYSTYGELAAACGMQGNIEDLELYSKKAIEIKWNYPIAHNNLGFALQTRGDLEGAINSYKTAIEHKPDYADAFFNLGNTQNAKKNFTEAINAFRNAIDLRPGEAKYHQALGKSLKEAKQFKEAVKAYYKAIEANPQLTDAYIELGKMMAENEDFSKADKLYKAALMLNPNDSRSLFFLGNSLKQQEDFHGAIKFYKEALSTCPNSAETHMNLGNTYQDIGEYQLAIESYMSAIAINQNSSDAHYNLAIAQNRSGDPEQAIRSYESAIKLDRRPQYLYSLAHTLLSIGKYEYGLELYEARTDLEEKDYHLLKFCESTKHSRVHTLEAGNLIVVSEQGLGDALHFMRYLKYLKALGIKHRFCVQTKLHLLIQSSGIELTPLTIEQANALNPLQWIPLLSLMKSLQISPERVLDNNPYIKTDLKLTAKWKRRFREFKRPIIGINWRGNRSDNKKKNRNIQINELRHIIENSDATFISLQRGVHENEIPDWLRKKLTKHQAEIHSLVNTNKASDFLEYASIVDNCDLVITTATTVAHLAAGMGKPTWIFLEKIPDWRWGLDGETTPWYRTAKLFRQTVDGDWSGPIATASHELKQISCDK